MSTIAYIVLCFNYLFADCKSIKEYFINKEKRECSLLIYQFILAEVGNWQSAVGKPAGLLFSSWQLAVGKTGRAS